MSDLNKKMEVLLKLMKQQTAALAKADGDDEEEPSLEDAGMHEFDPFEEEGDDADKWLADNDPSAETEAGEVSPGKGAQSKAPVENVVGPSKGAYAEWAPKASYSPEEKNRVQEYIKRGFTPREAERLSEVQRTDHPRTFEQALNHRVHPSAPSAAMLDMIKPHAKKWYERAMKQTDMEADPERNPIKHAAGKTSSAREEHRRAYKTAYNKFLTSPEYKDLESDPAKAHEAIEKWKSGYHEKNPEHNAKIASIASPVNIKDVMNVRKKNLEDGSARRWTARRRRRLYVEYRKRSDGIVCASESALHQSSENAARS